MSYPGQGQWGPPPQANGWGPPPDQNPANYGPPGPQQGGWGQPPAQGYNGPQQGGWPQQGPAQGAPGQWGQQPAPGGQWGGQPAQPQGQWGAPQQQAPQGPPPAQGSLAAFFSQPTIGGGPALKFPNIGDEHYMIVNRTVTSRDVEQQTGIGQNQGQPLVYKDGTPKWVMKIPGNVRPGPQNTDGKAQWYCQGAARDLLNAAIAQSGAPIVTEQTPNGPVQGYVPEPGSLIRVRLAGKRKTNVPGMNDANVWEVNYWRPDQGQIAAPQLGIEYPAAAELAQVTAPDPGSAGGTTPTATPPADQAQGMGGNGQQPGAAPAGPDPRWGMAPEQAVQYQQPAVQQGPPVGPPAGQWGQQPATAGAVAQGGQWAQQPAQNGAQQPAGPPQGVPAGPPPAVDWQSQQQPAQNGGGYIPTPTNQPPAGPPPGMAPDTAALQQTLTGR